VGSDESDPSVGVESDPSAGDASSEGSEPFESSEPSEDLVCLPITKEGSRAKITLRLCTFTSVTGIDIAN